MTSWGSAGRIVEVPAEPTPAGAARMVEALMAAFDGGPAVLPVGEVGGADVRAGARLDLPIDEDIALLVPTSGSTGVPKVVQLSSAALRASGTATHELLGGPGRWLLALPLTHVAGIQVLARSALAGFDPVALDLRHGFRVEALIDGMAALGSGRRYLSLVPTQLHRVLDSPEATAALATADGLLLGGAAASDAVLGRARAAGITVVTTYGMSETAGGCVYDGTPIPGARFRIRASDGRIQLGGAMVARGYRGLPELSAQLFADGWFTTSDLGAMRPDGRLRILGRADDVVITGGEKVVLGAVEASVAEHPGVREAAVVAVPDAEWGQRIVAWVIPAAPAPTRPTADDLDRIGASAPLSPRSSPGSSGAGLGEAVRAYVRADLGRAAAPREVRVVDELPRLALGKVDRAAIRAASS
jgi:O-succinylbenzoic acid--CoA ligase